MCDYLFPLLPTKSYAFIGVFVVTGAKKAMMHLLKRMMRRTIPTAKNLPRPRSLHKLREGPWAMTRPSLIFFLYDGSIDRSVAIVLMYS